jgi:glucokinase
MGKKKEHFFGIDIGGTNVKIGLVNQSGELLNKVKHRTHEVRERGDFVKAFIPILKQQFDQYPEVKKVGIGVPGTVTKDRTSTIELPNVPELDGVNLMAPLQQAFPDVVFHLENDANAAALGEYYFAPAKTPECFIFITMGTGIGGAAIIDGKIFKGGDGNGMEVGHIISSYGHSVEDEIGKKGIIKITKKYIKKGKFKTRLKKHKNLNSKEIVAAVHEGDPLAIEVFHKVGKILGEALVSVIRILDIKDVYIGGGVSDTFTYLEESMHATLDKHLTPYYTENINIRMAELGNNAGIVGAASLCFID